MHHTFRFVGLPPAIGLAALVLGATPHAGDACVALTGPRAASCPADRAHRLSADSLQLPNIPVERFTLPNGLTVLLSPDTSAPVVSVAVWYHVGSKNEHVGRTGFAHLFEHIMFQGSAHAVKGEHIKTIEDAGGTMNGTTNNDRTNYFETVPINYLATVLWLEADRMGSLLPALTQEKLDNQRDVVKNERRYRVDNQPYGSSDEVLDASLFPSPNPYSWPVIGSMTDLSAASLEDVDNFFRTYYAPNNATLSICGDINIAQTRALVEKYFGFIPRGPDIQRPTVSLSRLTAEKRLVLEDAKATLPRLEMVWPTVGVRSPDAAPLDALAAILTQDRVSRLTKLLVYDRQLATSVSAYNYTHEDEGAFYVVINPRPSVDLTRLEQLTDSVLNVLRTTAPTVEEVERTKRFAVVATITGLESTESRADQLAEGQTFFDNPLHFQVELKDAQAVTPGDVQRVASQYLTSGHVVLSMVPAGHLELASRPAKPFVNVTPPPERPAKGAQ